MGKKLTCINKDSSARGKEPSFCHAKSNFPSTTPHLFNTEQCRWCSMFLPSTALIANLNQT